MKKKNKLKLAGGLAIGIGLGVVGKKIADSIVEWEDEKLLEELNIIEQELHQSQGENDEALSSYDDYDELEEDSFALDFINYAPKSELMKIKGVGEVMANKVLDSAQFFDLEEVRTEIAQLPKAIFELEDYED